MSTVKISQLPIISSLNANTEKTLIAGVDLTSGLTGKMSVTTLADGMYSNNVLNVGGNPILYDNVVAQFSGSGYPYLQLNHQNFDGTGSTDFAAYANNSSGANNFVDMGINGMGFNDPDYTSMKPFDSYVFSHGPSNVDHRGNLIIGTASSAAQTFIIAGGTLEENIVGRIDSELFNFYNPLLVENDIITTNNVYTSGIIFNDNSILNSSPVNRLNAAFSKANNALSNVAAAIFGYDLTVSEDFKANTVEVVDRLSFSANGLISTPTGSNPNKHLTIETGTDTASGNGGTINITTGGTGIVNGYSGDINLNIGQGISGKGVIRLNGLVKFIDGTSQNTAASSAEYTQSAFLKANAAVANTTSINLPGDLRVTSNVSVGGFVDIIGSTWPTTQAFVQINAADNGNYVAPSNTNYMLHVTGKANSVTRVVLDSFGANTYPLLSGRMGRGSAATPAAVANNDVMMRIVGNGYTGTQFPVSSPTKIDFVASENFSDTNRGTRIEFWNTSISSNTIQRIASFNANEVSFTGTISPEKGFIYSANTYPGLQTAINISFSDGPVYRAQTSSGLSVTLTNFVAGKITELWLTNTSGNGQTYTHGVSEINSTTNSLTYSIPATSTIHARYYCMDGTLANTFVAVTHA